MSDLSRRQRELEREHQARTLHVRGELEPRPSPRDENTEAGERRQAFTSEARSTLRADISRLLVGLDAADRIVATYARIVPGDHRGETRSLEHHARRIRSILRALQETI